LQEQTMTAGPDISSLSQITSDEVLFRRYISAGERDALGELARRYAGLVYSAARRQVGNAAMAEDISQEVFMIFARKARTLRNASGIGGWLLRTTRYVAANAIRSESRYKRREEAAKNNRSEVAPDPSADQDDFWDQIRPLLDVGIAQLGQSDQAAVVLRFLRGQSFREVGEALGVSEDSARKRVDRALERLRKYLLRSGVPSTCGAGALGALLIGRAVQPAPAAIVAHASQAAASASVSSLPLSLAAMTPAAKAVIGFAAAAVIFCGGTAVYIARTQRTSPVATVASPVAAPASADQSTTASPADWQENFNSVYQLDDNQIVKHISPPFIPERQGFFDDEAMRRNRPTGEYSWAVFVVRAGGALHDDYSAGGSTSGFPGPSLAQLVQIMPQIASRSAMNGPPATRRQFHSWQVNTSPRLSDVKIPGDWIMRYDADPIDLVTGIVQQSAQDLHRTLSVRHIQVATDVIVVSGQTSGSATLQYPLGAGSGDGDLKFALDSILTPATGLRFWFDFTGSDPRVEFDFSAPLDLDQTADQRRKGLLDLLAARTGLTFTPEIRSVDKWTIDEPAGTQP
jgi:RNA polymerase sigma factor (sigma-70 family)